MAQLMDNESAVYLAQHLFVKYRNIDQNRSLDFYAHMRRSYEQAESVMGGVLSNNPWLEEYMVPEEICLGAALHDIGKLLSNRHFFHEPIGARFVERYGIECGITNDSSSAIRLGAMIRSHGVAYEKFSNDESAVFLGEDPVRFNPATWQQAIVAYAELTVLGYDAVTVEERIQDAKEKHKNNFLVVKAIDDAQSRIFDLAQRVERLSQNPLPESEIMSIGFLI